MPRWADYMAWQTRTLNRNLLMLELGVGFDSPTVIRWPFEKIVYVNQKSYLLRVHETLSQLPGEIGERAGRVSENSVDWILKLEREAGR